VENRSFCRGCSSNPVYLHITDSKAEILDGSFVRGKDTFETDRILRKRHGENGYENRLSVAAIGPAGENRVRFACICSDRGHIVATGGVGAVMGSKNLKAIVVQGSQKIPFDTGQAERLLQLTGQWRTEAHKTSLGQTIHHKGTLGLFGPYHSRGWVPVKNLTTNIIDNPEVFDGDRIRSELYRMIPRSCHGCTFAHCHAVEIKKGKYKGFVGEEPEYEIMAGFGSNWGISDPAAVTMLNGLNDRLGLDGKETSFLLSMIMEAYDRGFIDREALDGIDLRWGNVAAVETVLKKINSREGIGNILAEGVMRAAENLGDEFVNMAVYVKRGNAPHIHDPRTRWGTLFTQVISNMGSQEGMDMTVRANPELGFDKPTSDPDPYLALVQSKTGPKRQFEECLVFCYFQSCTFETMIETLNTITGAGYKKEDCLKIGRRIINLLRMFNIREGFTKESDSFSPRLGQSPVDGPGKGKSITATFESVRDAYYQAMQWPALR